MELKAELTVPELNLAFKVICNISGTVFLQVKQISPPKILEMVEIESQRREIQNSNFVLCASPRRSELEIYCSEDIKSLENRKNEARDEDPYPLFNCLQKFEIERSNAGLRLLNMLNYSYLDQNHLKHFECQPYFPLKTWRKKNIQEEKVIQRRVYLGSYLKYVRLPERRRVILDLVNFISQLPTSDEDESLFRMFDDESKKLTGQEVNFWAHKDDPNKLVELLSLLRFEEVSNLVKIVESVKNVDFGGKIRQNEKKGLESVLLRSIHVPGRVSWLIGACNLYPTDTLPQRLKIGENQVRQGLAIFRKSHPAWSRFLNLRTYFKAPIETEVFFLEEGEGYLKQNLKYVNDRQALVGDDVKRDTNTWFNIMGLRNKKLLKCFPDYLVNGVKTSELVRSPTRLAEKLKVKAEPLTCPVRFNPSKRCDKKFRAFDLSSYLIEVNKDHSTIYLIGCGKNLAYSFDLVAVNEVQLQPLDFYTPEIGFNVSFYNEKDSSIWLSNSSLLQGDAAKTVKESVRRLNFFETPMVTKITVPSLQQASAKPPLFQEGRFGYSESLSKYFSATETSIIIFENETDFSEIHKIIELKNLGTFERSKIKMLPLIPGQESGEKAVIVQYNRFRNWRTILFNFYKMEVVYDFDFEGDYCIKKDIELIKIEELNLNRTTQGGLLLERSEGNIMAGGFERGFLVSIVDSFFNRFLIINQTDGGGRAATQQQPGSCQIPYLVFLNSVNQSGELLSTSIIKSSYFCKKLYSLNFQQI